MQNAKFKMQKNSKRTARRVCILHFAFCLTALAAPPAYAQQADAGIVRFKHYGVNQDDKHIFEGERTVLIKRRSHWGEK